MTPKFFERVNQPFFVEKPCRQTKKRVGIFFEQEVNRSLSSNMLLSEVCGGEAINFPAERLMEMGRHCCRWVSFPLLYFRSVSAWCVFSRHSSNSSPSSLGILEGQDNPSVNTLLLDKPLQWKLRNGLHVNIIGQLYINILVCLLECYLRAGGTTQEVKKVKK